MTIVYFVVQAIVMMNRNGRGCFYAQVRGEILGFCAEKLMRRRSARTFSLIKHESEGIEDD